MFAMRCEQAADAGESASEATTIAGTCVGCAALVPRCCCHPRSRVPAPLSRLASTQVYPPSYSMRLNASGPSWALPKKNATKHFA